MAAVGIPTPCAGIWARHHLGDTGLLSPVVGRRLSLRWDTGSVPPVGRRHGVTCGGNQTWCHRPYGARCHRCYTAAMPAAAHGLVQPAVGRGAWRRLRDAAAALPGGTRARSARSGRTRPRPAAGPCCHRAPGAGRTTEHRPAVPGGTRTRRHPRYGPAVPAAPRPAPSGTARPRALRARRPEPPAGPRPAPGRPSARGRPGPPGPRPAPPRSAESGGMRGGRGAEGLRAGAPSGVPAPAAGGERRPRINHRPAPPPRS